MRLVPVNEATLSSRMIANQHDIYFLPWCKQWKTDTFGYVN